MFEKTPNETAKLHEGIVLAGFAEEGIAARMQRSFAVGNGIRCGHDNDGCRTTAPATAQVFKNLKAVASRKVDIENYQRGRGHRFPRVHGVKILHSLEAVADDMNNGFEPRPTERLFNEEHVGAVVFDDEDINLPVWRRGLVRGW